MRKTIFVRMLIFVVALGFVTTANASHRSSPVGTWLLTVTFPEGGPPPFKEFLVFHANGTVTETNTTLHANSALDPASPLPLNGSIGVGAWKHIGKRTVKFRFVKFVFNAGGIHEGYLVVAGQAKVHDDSLQAEATTELRFGPDLDNPFTVIPFGTAPSTATRITVH
ncbi:MAG: hypothetical protein KJO31_09765 [Gammaproteobacteria bacterium]|nr:hypothetical protein [Gammaproteobacteria bacterium]